MFKNFMHCYCWGQISSKWFFSMTLLAMSMCFVLPVHANTYYVGTNGSDGHTPAQAESSSTPWKTLQHAASVVVAGDTVQVLAGTYSKVGTAIVPAHSGTSSAWITYNGQPGAIINGDPIQLANVSYINIQGLTVENITNSAEGQAGISMVGCNHINVTGCTTSKTYSSGISVWGIPWDSDGPGAAYPSYNIYIAYDTIDMACNGGNNECLTIANGVLNSEVSHCLIENTGTYTHGQDGGEALDVKLSCYNIWIDHNEIKQNTKTALMLDSARANRSGKQDPGLNNIYIYDNKIDQNTGNELTLETELDGSGDVGPLQNVYVYDNLIYDNNESGIYLSSADNGTIHSVHSNVYIYNNTVLNNNKTGGFSEINDADAYMTNLQIEDNIAWSVHTDYTINLHGHAATLANNYEQDPIVVSGVTEPCDLHLKSISPAIGAGASTGFSGTTTDFDGNARPTSGGGYDIGALQYEITAAANTYKITPKSAPAMGLDCENYGTSDGTNVQLYTYAPNSNKEWLVTRNGNGTFTIATLGNALEGLDCEGAVYTNGTNIQLYHGLGNPQQEWILTPTSSGYYEIASEGAPAQVIECAGGGTANNTNIDLWAYSGGDGQQWAFLAP